MGGMVVEQGIGVKMAPPKPPLVFRGTGPTTGWFALPAAFFGAVLVAALGAAAGPILTGLGAPASLAELARAVAVAGAGMILMSMVFVPAVRRTPEALFGTYMGIGQATVLGLFVAAYLDPAVKSRLLDPVGFIVSSDVLTQLEGDVYPIAVGYIVYFIVFSFFAPVSLILFRYAVMKRK